LNGCEENNPKQTDPPPAEKPQANGNNVEDLCPRDDGDELDTTCAQPCGEIVIDPPVGGFPGCADLSTGFDFPPGGDNCSKECSGKRYCIYESDPDLVPCERTNYPCGQCDPPQDRHYIDCRCCGKEIQCAVPRVFRRENVTGDPQKDKTTKFPNTRLADRLRAAEGCKFVQCEDLESPIDCSDCCNGRGYKIIYDASKSNPSNDFYYYDIECL
jgi:hypothetical protein